MNSKLSLMRVCWILLMAFSVFCLFMCVNAYLSSDVGKSQERFMRGIQVYAFILFISAYGFYRYLGPFVFMPLSLGFVSVSVDRGGNQVNQLFFFLFFGLIFGLFIDYIISVAQREKNRMEKAKRQEEPEFNPFDNR